MYKATLVVLTACVAAAVGYRVDTIVEIYGGEVVDTIEQAPYMAYLNFESSICGGSVIHPQFILTAAHCVEDLSSDDFNVIINTTVPFKSTNMLAVKEIYVHDKYSNKTMDYDIALIQLKKAVTTPTIEVADEDTALTDGDKLDIYGWGETENIDYPNRLRHISLPLFDFDKCVTLMSTLIDITITPRMFCAGGFVDDRDSCSGDSGGPVLKGSKQVGLVSFGAEGACGVIPGVYTKLSAFTSWINDNIEEYAESK